MSSPTPTSRPRSPPDSNSHRPDIFQAEDLILPDGPIGEETAELLNNFVHPHHESYATEETLVGDSESSEAEWREMQSLPWWKRPSPWWLLCLLPFTAVAMSATLAPRIEVYTILVCRILRPDIYHGEDAGLYSMEAYIPTRTQKCAADPVVQASVAKLAAAMTTSMGILSCLTTGWWGAFSDRHGRGSVMGISVVGLLLTDFCYILVTHFPDYFPGGYWFLLIGPIVEGTLGGFTSAVAAIHAYQADTTNDHERSRIFTLSLGLLFTGMAVGPTLGSLLIHSTGNVLAVFYFAAGCHLSYAFFIWFILPESLTSTYRLRARTKYAEELRINFAGRVNHLGSKLTYFAQRLFTFLSPLTVFSPRVQKDDHNPLKREERDWNLVLMAVAYAITISIMGSYTYKFQYAASTFGWTSETLGYWLSLVGLARAIYLTIILPVIIKLFKPKPIVIEISEEPSETSPLLSNTATNGHDTAKKTKEIHSPAFDLGLARASLVIEIIAYSFMGLAPTPLAFTLFGMLGSMGTAFTPAMQTVTLALYVKRGGTESGRLFGALSVLQALSSQIIGPSLYGYVYVKTVANFPRAIFFVSVGSVVIASIFLTGVRLPKEVYSPREMEVSSDDDLEERARVR